MEQITFLDRESGKICVEKVYGAGLLRLLYGHGIAETPIGKLLRKATTHNGLFSRLAGWWKRQRWTARSIAPFIEKYEIDSSEFRDPIESFRSFNDFFVRCLKPESRPISPGSDTAIIPADGRYLFFPSVAECDNFFVKGQSFNLSSLLRSDPLAREYRSAAMVIARLCPTDYHRFHFPCDCTPGSPSLINGTLHSVNPIALYKNGAIFMENKRVLTILNTRTFGKILFIEIGAAAVGSITQSYHPDQRCKKGDEKGFFSFGGSSLILLFPPQSIVFDRDLTAATRRKMEVKCLMGQPLGHSATASLHKKPH